jgi:hypothetical protein
VPVPALVTVLMPGVSCANGGMYTEWTGEMPTTAALHSECLSFSKNQNSALDDDVSSIRTTETRTNVIFAAEIQNVGIAGRVCIREWFEWQMPH